MTAEQIEPSRHLLRELGLGLDRAGDDIHGSAEVVPELCVPGTPYVRTSVLATWADQTCGLIALDSVAPRVPVTLQLDINVPRPRETSRVDLVTTLIKAGRSVVFVRIDFTDDTGHHLGIGTASFMPAPDPSMLMPESHLASAAALPRLPRGRLTMPFAERARCERTTPGTAVLPRSDDGLNSSNTVNGGLIALAVEEAVLGATAGTALTSLALRYLLPVRTGPAVAIADVDGSVATVEVRDAGANDRLAVFATATVTETS